VDFRQERRWKQALAMVISKAVMEYHLSEDKKSLQAKVSIFLLLFREVLLNGHLFVQT